MVVQFLLYREDTLCQWWAHCENLRFWDVDGGNMVESNYYFNTCGLRCLWCIVQHDAEHTWQKSTARLFKTMGPHSARLWGLKFKTATKRQQHISSVLAHLHWELVVSRIDFIFCWLIVHCSESFQWFIPYVHEHLGPSLLPHSNSDKISDVWSR